MDNQETIDIFNGIMRASKSFVYRCENDEAVTMTYLSGSVDQITGCQQSQLINNAELSYASLCHPDDLRPMIDAVDAAIEIKKPWDLDYRLVRPDGSIILVRERGEAVYGEGGKVKFLQGLVVDASVEHTLRLKLEDNVKQTEKQNHDILALAETIVTSVRESLMLSFNAKIEAGRVGDAGLAFGVIAEEIRRLANKNADCAKEITTRMRY